MRRNPDWQLAIEGHTDNVASDKYNLDLSARRAAAVRAALGTQFGIAGTRLTTAGLGESRPQDRNDTMEGRARNRRVELVRR
jgi:outer membrane protein OmpA-like peptidoglycan-associated protein